MHVSILRRGSVGGAAKRVSPTCTSGIVSFIEGTSTPVGTLSATATVHGATSDRGSFLGRSLLRAVC